LGFVFVVHYLYLVMLRNTILALAALAATATATSTTSASSSIPTIVIGGAGGAQTFTPPQLLNLPVGSKVHFSFNQANHSLVQTAFGTPCEAPNNDTAFYSGFVKTFNVNGNQTDSIFEIEIKDTNPIWFYCAQAKHCQNKMVGGINFNATGPKNLDAFISAAAAQTSPTIGAVPTRNVVQGGNFIQISQQDIFDPPNPVVSSSSSSTETIIIQINVAIITVNDGKTTTIGRTNLSYPPQSIPGVGSQIIYISPVISGRATSYTSVWSTPGPNDAAPTTTQIAVSSTTTAGSSGFAAAASTTSAGVAGATGGAGAAAGKPAAGTSSGSGVFTGAAVAVGVVREMTYLVGGAVVGILVLV